MPEASSVLRREFYQIVEQMITEDGSLVARLPPKPEEPLPSDCCGCSCQPCVFDMYRDDLLDWGIRCLTQLAPDKYPRLKLQKLREDGESLEFGPMVGDQFILNPSSYTTMEILKVIPQSSDSFLFRIKLPDDRKQLVIPLGSHVIIKLTTQQGRSITRQFTPVVFPDQIGSFDLLIKLYEHGKMSQILRSLKTGEKVDVRGPFGVFTYKAKEYSDVLLFASGTGISPMFQLIEKVLADPDETTRVKLLYTSRNYDSIYLKNKFKEWRRYWNFTTCYYLSRENDPTKIRYGDDVRFQKIDKDVVTTELKKLQTPDKCLVLVCGSNCFMKDMINCVTKSGIIVKRLFKF